MEPQFQNSFIPKNPIVSSARGGPTEAVTVNIFSAIAGVLFTIALLLAGGVFVYKNIIVHSIAEADQDLNAARKAFEPEKITELIDANAQISTATKLLQQHVVVSKVLELIQELLVKRMRFESLTYNMKDSVPTLSGIAQAQTYNALAEQLDIFSKSEFISNPVFSNFGLGENGIVKVNFTSGLSPKILSYKDTIQ